jgi:hypothetical protein
MIDLIVSNSSASLRMFLAASPHKYFFKRKKGKKESSFISRRMFRPKGNGINPWIDVDDILDTACAGYSDEDLLRKFYAVVFWLPGFALAWLYSADHSGGYLRFSFFLF